MKVKRSLQWALAASVALSALALWPRKVPPLVGVADLALRGADAAQSAASGQALPASIQAWSIDVTAVRGDPFALPAPRAPMPQQVTPSVPGLVATQVPAPPTAPPVQYRFFGRMTSPDGQATTLLARGESVVAVSAGMTLADGYVVQGVSAEAVRLSYPSLGTVVDLPVPPPPALAR